MFSACMCVCLVVLIWKFIPWERVCHMVYCLFSNRKGFGNGEKPGSLCLGLEHLGINIFARLMTYIGALIPYWLPSWYCSASECSVI